VAESPIPCGHFFFFHFHGDSMTTRPVSFLLALGATALFTSGCGGDTKGSGGSGGSGSSVTGTVTSTSTSGGMGGDAPGPCVDGVLNGAETDIDCGGLCPRCDDGKKCTSSADCISNTCIEGVCAKPTCTDSTKDGKETDVDCGGTCSPCADGKSCAFASDCASGLCASGVCQASQCNDSVANGTETGVDCGGSCPHCPDGEGCLVGADCASTICDMAVCKGNVTWAARGGDAGDQAALGVAFDLQGNVIVTGAFHGAIDWGGGALVSAGGADIFLAKLDKTGKHVWSKRFGDASDQTAAGVVVTGNGQIWLAGGITGNVDFGGGALASADPLGDAFLASFGPGGAYVSAKRFGGALAQRATALAIGINGDLYLGGVFDGSLDLGCGPLLGAGSGDLFVSRLDAGGGCIFSKGFGDASTQELLALAPDPAHNVFLGGRFKGTVNFGGAPLTMPATTFGAFAAKLDGAGAHLFSTAFGNTTAAQETTGVATDLSGNVFVAGSFSGTLTAGATTLTSAGMRDLFLVKLDPGGAVVWARSYGDAADQAGVLHIAVDTLGNVVLAGTLQSSLDLGLGLLTSVGGDDVFLGKLDAAGNPLWNRTIGDSAAQQVHSLTLLGSTKAAIGGSFGGSPAFGETVLKSGGGDDAFAAAIETP
jgi:hypothetical protein